MCAVNNRSTGTGKGGIFGGREESTKEADRGEGIYVAQLKGREVKAIAAFIRFL